MISSFLIPRYRPAAALSLKTDGKNFKYFFLSGRIFQNRTEYIK